MPPRPLFPFLVVWLLLGPHSPSITAQLAVINTQKKLTESIRNNPACALLELKELIPGIQYDLRYADTNNFVNRAMYPTHTNITFLRRDPARALQKVQAELAASGLGLKIWDAYRPYAVTVAFWELIGDERYVANPAKGSGHNRGLAVDLTVIQLNTGTELPMGTGFDHFSDTAHQDFTQLPEECLQNRQLLKQTMTKHGFLPYAEEWWHFSWPNPQLYEVLNIPFHKIKRKH